MRGRAESRLTHRPDHPLLALVLAEQHRRPCGFAAQRIHHHTRIRIRLGLDRAAEFQKQPATARRKHRSSFGVQSFRAHVAHEKVVESFEADRLEFEEARHVVRGVVNRRIAEDEGTARGRRVDEAALRFEHDRARAFAADKRSRDVESILRKQLVEVVAGDAPRDFREAGAHEVRVCVADLSEPRVDLGFAAGGAPDVVVSRLADAHARAVVQKHVEPFDVVDGLPRHQRMHAAGVVADHSAERAMRVRRGIRAERELVLLGLGAEIVEHDAGLDARELANGIELDHTIHVLREVEDDGDVAALAGQARPAAARENRRTELARQGHGRDHVIGAFRNDDADRNLPVVRRIGRVERARAVVETNLSFDLASQRRGKRRSVDVQVLQTVVMLEPLVNRAFRMWKGNGIIAAELSAHSTREYRSRPRVGQGVRRVRLRATDAGRWTRHPALAVALASNDVNRLVALIARHGTPLVWLNVFLEQIGLPIPAVPTLIIAGALSRDGKMSSTAIIAGSVIASIAADWIWFILGRRLGYRVLATMCRISLSPDSCVRDTEARFERFGMPSLLFAKFVPGFSTVAPPLAGATNHSAIEFLIYDAIGALLWAGASVAAGRVFHNAIDRVLKQLAEPRLLGCRGRRVPAGARHRREVVAALPVSAATAAGTDLAERAARASRGKTRSAHHRRAHGGRRAAAIRGTSLARSSFRPS